MSFIIPDKINMFNVYQTGIKQIGISGEVSLPEIKQTSSTLSGPGILGEYDSPAIGQFEHMEQEIPFTQLFNNIFFLMNPLMAVDLTLRGSIQVKDSLGNTSFQGMRIVFRGSFSEFSGGKVKQGEGTESTVKLALSYYMIEIGGVKCLEIDKLNSIFKVNGIDVLLKARALC